MWLCAFNKEDVYCFLFTEEYKKSIIELTNITCCVNLLFDVYHAFYWLNITCFNRGTSDTEYRSISRCLEINTYPLKSLKKRLLKYFYKQEYLLHTDTHIMFSFLFSVMYNQIIIVSFGKRFSRLHYVRGNETM